MSKAALLEKTMAAGAQPDMFHVYAGWTARQLEGVVPESQLSGTTLEGEVKLGAWYIFSGDVSVVFAVRPEMVWPRIIERID